MDDTLEIFVVNSFQTATGGESSSIIDIIE